jgi:hypothetical protein
VVAGGGEGGQGFSVSERILKGKGKQSRYRPGVAQWVS